MMTSLRSASPRSSDRRTMHKGSRELKILLVYFSCASLGIFTVTFRELFRKETMYSTSFEEEGDWKGWGRGKQRKGHD